ncbi:MAG TPA: SDR family oxidoreductase [Bryobacteraceae bacterium]|nr:SDR family oxidoreductase [Bryobacteraceae bacterium]
MELGLKGRVAAITGGSRGIGKAIARGLAAEGVNLVLLARGKEQLEKTAEEVSQESGVQVLSVAADVTNAESLKAAAAVAKNRFGTIHIVVNNAGGPIRRMDRQITWPDTDWADDVNLKTIGMLRTVQAFLPLMPRDGTGRIINNSGVAATLVFSTALTHGLNNAAMNQVTGYLANDLAGDRITVNAVVPGVVGTEAREIWAENMSKQQGKTKAEFLADFCRRMGVIAGRWASMEEVAGAVVFLSSDRGQYINGSQLVIDGGMSVNPRPA